MQHSALQSFIPARRVKAAGRWHLGPGACVGSVAAAEPQEAPLLDPNSKLMTAQDAARIHDAHNPELPRIVEAEQHVEVLLEKWVVPAACTGTSVRLNLARRDAHSLLASCLCGRGTVGPR
jgi:hypothetical protein